MKLDNKFKGFLNLTRFGISLFGCIGLFVSGFLAEDINGFHIEYLIAFIIVLVAASGAFAINDYFDYEIDKINMRDERPLVNEILSRNTALFTGVISLLIVILLSLLLNLAAMILIFISLPIFYGYSLGLKKILLFKNLLIAYSYLSTILLGSLVMDSQLEPLIIYFAIMGFIVGLANEIMFDIADMKGDREKGIKTIATEFNMKTAAIISTLLYIIIIILDPMPYFLDIDERLYFDHIFLILILIPVGSYVLLSTSLLKNQSNENISRLRTLVFIIMQFGTISYLIGVLI
jgi:geranylgeranylglycerol-phosphate geranylgeranyltransferase